MSRPNEIIERRRAGLEFAGAHQTSFFDMSGPAVMIGMADELKEPDVAALKDAVRSLAPWRKGPFDLFGLEVESAWKSDLRWHRARQAAGPLEGRRICDVGCNNGYYMFRMIAHGPHSVLGLDPAQDCADQFEFLSRLIRRELPIEFEQRGYEALRQRPSQFDVVFCMGVVYHQRNPLDVLEAVHTSLAAGGLALVESLVFEQPGDLVLFPPGRYAGMKGVWFVPTPDALVSWMRRTGFRDVKAFDVYSYEGEQQTTELGVVPGLSEFLDPEDSARTVEGLPTPKRMIVTALK